MTLAMDRGLKTVAFCCLGTGPWYKFPALNAALIALRETRKFLDTHPTHCFERIIFCVYKDDDLEAYSQFFPIFFPPTDDDLVIAHSNNKSHGSSSRFRALTQEVSVQVNSVTQQLKTFDAGSISTPQSVAQQLSSIAVLIDVFPTEGTRQLFGHSMKNLDLLCSVMFSVCSNITEIVELINSDDWSGPDRQAIWHEYNRRMQERLGLNLSEIVSLCKEFAQRLSKIMERNVPVPHEMKIIGTRLMAWLTEQNGEGQSVRNHFEETLLSRQYQLEATVKDSLGSVKKLNEVPSLAQLYEQGALQPTRTRISASSRSNSVVCLAKEDITRLEVDIIGKPKK